VQTRQEGAGFGVVHSGARSQTRPAAVRIAQKPNYFGALDLTPGSGMNDQRTALALRATEAGTLLARLAALN